jgi:diacylglycerol O-acyltransferase / wax synthase
MAAPPSEPSVRYMQSARLTPLDATFLELEDADETAHMHIGAVLVFHPPAGGRAPSVHELRAAIEPRLPALPLYRCRLSEPKPRGLHWPHWVEDADFDLSHHITAATLPAPGGREQLYAWAANYWSERLERDRPLWDMALVTGLEGGCWAICTKTHHCLVDGVGSVDAAYLLLDTEPDAHPVLAPERLDTDGERSSLFFRAPAAIAHGARAGIDVALHPSKLFDALSRSRAMAELVARDELVAAPRTSINNPIGVHRRFDVVRVPLTDVKLIKNRLGGTVNDVILAAATAGLRELLFARGDALPSDGLRAMVPVNIRAAGEKLGNRVSSLFVHLPVAEDNPLQRYVHTLDHAEGDKSGTQARGGETLVQLAGLAPPVLHSFLARSLYASRLFNVTITNVPGPQQPLYACGSRMTEVFPLVPLAADHSVGIAIVSYDGALYFGLIADRDSTADLEILSRGIAREIARLHELASETAAVGFP